MEQSGEVKGMEMVMMMMMIPMKSSSMVMTMATIYPLREGIPMADFSLPESSFFLCCFCPVATAELFCDSPLVLGFLEA